MVAKK